MFMARDLCRLIVSFTIPTAVVLSTWIGVGGCGWPISVRVRRIILASMVFKKRAPNLASAADAATHLRIAHCVSIAPFNLMVHPSLGILLALGAVK